MTTNFIVKPLEKNIFVELLSKSEEQLAKVNARRLIADSKPGYPCRVSLIEAEVGERVLLIPFKHHDVPSPYQASGLFSFAKMPKQLNWKLTKYLKY